MKPVFEAVVTTIQPPTTSMCQLAERLLECGGRMTVVGDRSGPQSFDLPGVRFLSIEEQRTLPFALAGLLSEGTYARKNLGYLMAMSAGVNCIYETDDDNAPMRNWSVRTAMAEAERLTQEGWTNIYRLFTEESVWPRGFPLRHIASTRTGIGGNTVGECESPIQQGLTNGDADVDAVWRLTQGREICFERERSVWLPPGAWCPFNSQNTWWWPRAYALMYLPSHCPFRMTDIWRGFVAQRCLWEEGFGIVFHGADTIQRRNDHDLMRDFADELAGTLRNEEFAGVLASVSLDAGLGSAAGNLWRCYEALVAEEFFPTTELTLVETWLADVENVTRRSACACQSTMPVSSLS